MTIEEQVQDHETRIAALENAPKATPHNTPETNPFMGRGPAAEPREPIGEDFQRVFGFWADPLGRRQIAPGSEEETIWLTKQAQFGGIVPAPAELAEKIAAVEEFYGAKGFDVTAICIALGSQQYLVFEGLPGLDFGTPRCACFGVRLFGLTNADANIAAIEKRRE